MSSNERVEDCRHDEVCNATTSVAPSSCQSIGRPDNVLVEEACAPDLARDECCS